MKSLRARVEALESSARQALGDRALDLFVDATSADPAKTAAFEELRGAVTGRLHELYDAIRQPLEAVDEWPPRVTTEDDERPNDS